MPQSNHRIQPLAGVVLIHRVVAVSAAADAERQAQVSPEWKGGMSWLKQQWSWAK